MGGKKKEGTKVTKPINIYSFWDFDNKDGLSQKELIEKNLKKYIDECEKAFYRPKFREYLMDNEAVLNDILRYAKELGFVDENATIDDISFEYGEYRIPYGYYKFLGDFGMFTPDGEASPIKPLSLAEYDFDKAVEFFADSKKLRTNELLQQFENGAVRERYRKMVEDGELTAEQLEEIIRGKRSEVVREVVDREKRFALSNGDLTSDGSTTSPDTRYALSDPITPEMEAEYLELAKNPEKNDARLREIVEEAARANGYTVEAYHGTSKGGFTWFDTYSYYSKFGLFGTGAYFTEDKEIAEQYTKKGKGTTPQVYHVYLKITSPIDMDAKADINAWNKAFAVEDYFSPLEGEMTNEQAFRHMVEDLEYNEVYSYDAAEIVRNVFENMGYNGITHIGGGRVKQSDGTKHRVWIAFESEQAKSADPVTYDDKGNIIPLSERFNPERTDIRYSLSDGGLDSKSNKGYNKKGSHLLKNGENGGRDENINETALAYVSITRVKMKNFPPYNESESDANEWATRWAHRTDVEAGAQTLAFYHGRCYVIGKYESMALKYQIEGRIKYSDYLAIREELEEDAKNREKQSKKKTADFIGERHRRRNSDERRGQGADNSSDEHGGKDREVLRLDRKQDGERGTQSNTDRSDEYDSEDRTAGSVKENKRYSFSDSFPAEGMSDTELENAQTVIKDLKTRAMASRFLDGYASYTPERMERELKASSSSDVIDYAKSYITWVEPTDFIYATTTSSESRQMLKEEAGELDIERLRNQEQPIHLTVDFETGEIVGHEGRHRMLALQKAGVDKVAVIIDALNDDRHHTKPIEFISLKGQRFGEYRKGTDMSLHDMLPLSKRYAYVARGLFTNEPKSGVRYQLTDAEAIAEAERLASEYGAIPKGEKAVRDVTVPQKISDTKYVSHAMRTLEEAGITPEPMVAEFDRRILDGMGTYERIGDVEAKREAEEYIKYNGFEDSMSDWFSWQKNGSVGKKELAIAITLYNQCVTNGDVENAMKLAALLYTLTESVLKY